MMLKINNNEYKVLSSKVNYIDVVYNNWKKGYSIVVLLDIELNNEKGYISIDVDFFDDKDFKNIENRKYLELPTELDSKISLIEIYDTLNFIDFIDSEVKVVFRNIVDNEIETEIYIDDEYIKLNYIGKLQLNYNND